MESVYNLQIAHCSPIHLVCAFNFLYLGYAQPKSSLVIFHPSSFICHLYSNKVSPSGAVSLTSHLLVIESWPLRGRVSFGVVYRELAHQLRSTIIVRF
jgi:hypothetical protein